MSMLPVTFRLSLFEADPVDTKRSTKVLLWLLQGLVQADVLWIGSQVAAGESLENLSIYNPSSKVVYKLDEGVNDWLDIPNIIKRGFADCKSLASWRIAELRAAGINAHPLIRWPDHPTTPGRRILHALVRWPDNRVEDPSLSLGMKGTIYRYPKFVKPYEGS